MAVQEKALIYANEQIGPELFEMEIVTPEIALAGEPGQFVHVKSGRGNDPLLRRPLSLYDVDRETGRIKLLYKTVGAGTGLLSKLRTSEFVDIMGPLGKGFTIPADQSRVILVGGGIGIAPLLYLTRVLLTRGCKAQVFYGADNKAQLAAANSFVNLGADLKIATRDGGTGYHGLITDYLTEALVPSEADYLYTCGPEMMMALVGALAEKHNIPGEVSLEEYMACGVGACLGCARQLKSSEENYVKICKDGPVFPLASIEWPLASESSRYAPPDKGGGCF